MTMHRRAVPTTFETLGDRQVRIRMSTGQRARDGHILDPQGCDLTNFLANPIVLYAHDTTKPVGRADEVSVQPDCIMATINFAPVGVSPTADEVCGLVKADILRGISIGFDILDGDPIEPNRPRAGIRATRWELYECTVCSVPVDTGATVTARAVADSDWKVGAARDLPIEDSDAWDGSAAEASIFEHAGGDDFDPAKARKGFLVYDATSPKLKGSYKLPIAHVADGDMKVPRGAIRAAASRLPQTDIPEDVKTSAGAVLDHYKEKAGMTASDDEKGRAFAAKRTRMLTATPKLKLRGLYDVAQLAHMVQHLGYIHGESVWEEELEGDDSKVPAMLGEALKGLGETLIAMTTEEVNELLSGKGLDEIPPVEDVVVIEDRAYVAAGKTPAIRAWRQGLAAMMVRAGKAISQANAAKIDQAGDHLNEAANRAKEASDHTGKAIEHGEAMTDLHGKATTAHDKMNAAIEDANGSAPADVAAKIAKVQQAHKQLGKHLTAMGERCAAIGDVQADAQGAIAGAQRCMRSAIRCVRGVHDAGDDTDEAEIQTSNGDAESEGTENNRALTPEARLRRLAALELSGA
nr:HK97 family phage prohead protease [uncultured Rhodopila sp.]